LAPPGSLPTGKAAAKSIQLQQGTLAFPAMPSIQANTAESYLQKQSFFAKAACKSCACRFKDQKPLLCDLGTQQKQFTSSDC